MELVSFIILITVSFLIAAVFQNEKAARISVFIKAFIAEFLFVSMLAILIPDVFAGAKAWGINFNMAVLGVSLFLATLIGLKAAFPFIS